MKPAPRRAAAVALTVAALVATGCSAINYQATTHQYSASDGVRFDVDDVKLRHISLVSAEEGGPGRLIGLISYGTALTTAEVEEADPAEVELQIEGETFDFTLAPGEAVNLEHDEELIVPAVGAAPGSMQQVNVSVNGEQGEFNATVLDGALQEYRALLPEEFDESVVEHLEHGPDTWGSGAAHYDADDDGH